MGGGERDSHFCVRRTEKQFIRENCGERPLPTSMTCTRTVAWKQASLSLSILLKFTKLYLLIFESLRLSQEEVRLKYAGVSSHTVLLKTHYKRILHWAYYRFAANTSRCHPLRICAWGRFRLSETPCGYKRSIQTSQKYIQQDNDRVLQIPYHSSTHIMTSCCSNTIHELNKAFFKLIY